ncbi:TFIIIC-sub6 domain-containing protein [Mycena kentingensis (nom. inval.)]|nr:TFIIIC-sub6 domain-containing protein [Mycena kentingensis (nom. inval.)]
MSTQFSTLVPHYTHVDSFSADDDYDDEEEVFYVTLDLGGAVDSALIPSSQSYRLIGLDTPTPFLQISGAVFRGRHDELLGTELLFTDKESADWSKRTIAHVANTERRIAFTEVHLKPKTPMAAPHEMLLPGQAVFAIQTDLGEPRPDIDLDRLVGKTGPTTTRKRREKPKDGEAGQEVKKAKGKGKGRARGYGSG